MTIQLRAYDHGRAETFRAIGTRLCNLTKGLAGVARELESWQGEVAGRAVPVMSARDAETLVASSARMWKSGEEERVAYGPSATAEHEGKRVGRVAMVAGIAPLGLPVWVPNQTEAQIDGAAEREVRGDPERVQQAFQALITASQPAWAYVALDDDPPAPVPPFSDGAPVVGWLTYLSSAYPALPRLPEPTVVHDVGTGVLIVAHSSKPDAAAIARVTKLLGEAGVLLPAYKLSKPA
jgi:hypothetical protein